MSSSKSSFGTDAQRHRLDLGPVRRHRLQQRARGGHHDPQRRAQPGVVGMRQPAQQHQPRADGVDAGREPLVRQRLPGREQRHRVAEHAAQFGGQVVGLAAGGGDHQQRTLPGQRGGDEHPRAGRADQRQFGGPLGRALDADRWKVGAVSASSTSPAVGVWTWWCPGAVMMTQPILGR